MLLKPAVQHDLPKDTYMGSTGIKHCATLSVELQSKHVEHAERAMECVGAYLVSARPGEPPCTGSRSACPKSMTLKRRGCCCCSMI